MFFRPKGEYLTSKIKILDQNLALCDCHFVHFQGQKTCFLGFLKVVLELFRNCLGIVFGFKNPVLRFIFGSKLLPGRVHVQLFYDEPKFSFVSTPFQLDCEKGSEQKQVLQIS